MSALGSAGTRLGTVRRLSRNRDVQRLASCLAVGLVVALMTGRPGTVTAPTAGIAASLGHTRVFAFLGLGVLLWGVVFVRERFREGIREASDVLTGLPRQLLADRRVRYPSYLAVLALAVVLPPLLNSFWQEVLVDQIGIYVLLALGLNVVVGYAGLLDLGYIAFYAIGAYTAAYWTGSLPVQPPMILNPFWTFPLAVLTAMIAGVILGAPTLRLRGDYLAIVTLGFGEIIQIVATNLTSIDGGPQGVASATGVPHFSIHLAGVHYRWTLANLPYYYLLLGLVVVVLVGFRLLEESRVGRAWTAIREDEVAAEACGINALKYKILAFSIGASTSGFAGVLFASKVGFFDPGVFTVQTSILVLVLVIFGGMGSLPGAVVGAAVLQWLPQWLRGRIQEQDLFIYVGAVLVAMMIFRPQGLIPSRRRSRELGLAESGIGGADAMGAPGEAP